MLRHILPIARYTLLEALRNRLLGLALILVAAGLAFTQFLQQVAITESSQIQAALLAALFRLGAVFMLAGFVVTSMVREFNDKVMELILSRPLRRSSYFFGKLAGYAAVALALALISSLPLALFAPAERVALWGLSLACELLLVTAFALFCVLLADAGDVGARGGRRLLSALALDQRAADHGRRSLDGRPAWGRKSSISSSTRSRSCCPAWTA